MYTTLGYGFWEFWAPYDPVNGVYGEHKCLFDGENKLIFIDPSVSELSVKEDIYSDWKEWILVRDNSKYLPAIRTIGGDNTTVGQKAGDIYFLINEWRLYIDHTVLIDGVIFSDDFPSPFVQASGTQIVTNKVSSLVTTPVGDAPSVEEIRQEMDINSSKLTSIESLVNSIDSDLQMLLATMTPLEFWSFLLTTPTVSGSAAEKLKQVLTTGNFIALK